MVGVEEEKVKAEGEWWKKETPWKRMKLWKKTGLVGLIIGIVGFSGLGADPTVFSFLTIPSIPVGVVIGYLLGDCTSTGCFLTYWHTGLHFFHITSY